jgi:Peptidase family M1 domain
MRVRAVLLCACLLVRADLSSVAPTGAQEDLSSDAQGAQEDGVTRLVLAIEYAIRTSDNAALRALARPDVSKVRLSEFALAMTQTPVSQLTLKERDRAPLTNGGQRLLLEILTVTGGEGRVWTWRVDALPGAPGEPWMIADVERYTVITGLFRLALDTTREWEVRNLTITAPDLTLTVASGYAFAANVPDGPTALVVVGRGKAEFSPASDAERGQVRIFAGTDVLRTAFDSVFIRVPPAEFDARVSESALKPGPIDPSHVRRAAQIFDTQLPRSFQIDLNDLSTSQWSLVPAFGDFVAEIATPKYGGLTYARSSSEPEDVSLFDRRRRRNIAVYTSAARMASRGRFFSEDERLDYDVTHYDVDASFSPERLWLDGTARLSIRTRSTLAATMTIRLADPLVVRSVTSPQFGRLLNLRVVGQNNVLIGLPGVVPADTEFDLVVTYGGRLPPQSVDREAIAVQESSQREEVSIPAEPQWTYSNRSYWYPQATVTEYATAKITLTVPGEYDVVASGRPQGPPALLPGPAGQRPRKRFVFEGAQPLRYLAFVVSRFQSAPPASIKIRDEADPLTLIVEANPRQTSRMRQRGEQASDILKYYGSLLADAPYNSFTLAMTESDLPGGHSPAYFALVNETLPSSRYVWTNDPVAFQSYPTFFLAHEVAHQWWGQAVGWKNYHEQWLSEGFAQYFAAMYAQKERGPEVFGSVIRQMRRSAVDMSPQGPVYLGYRLGHIRSEGRVFRALVYNKGAMVLHMLRRLIGDEAFFAGLRDFYSTWRYKKAGTDDLRAAMEKAAAGRPLERFFERWIFSSGIPEVRFTSIVEGSAVKVRFEQLGDVYDVPIAVTATYADGTTEDFLVKVTDKSVEEVFQLKRAVRSVEANKDGGALVEIVK